MAPVLPNNGLKDIKMPAPDPNGLTYDETTTGAPMVRAEIWGSRNRPFWEGNAKHRIARATAVLKRLKLDGWACRWCRDPIPMYRRADARYCCEGCRKRAARDRRRGVEQCLCPLV